VTLREQVAQLFEEARDDVYRYLLMLGLHPPQAQDTTQEVFLRLYTTLKKGETIENHRAWVFRVAHNLGLNTRQKQNNYAPLDPDFQSRLSSPQLNPEQAALERERRSRIERAIQGLSEQQRRCLFLRMQGLRYPEIGAVLGIGASTVGEFLQRAIAKLRKEN
jgi:RNA polymerase sigma-70 factor (ECF subfamily)